MKGTETLPATHTQPLKAAAVSVDDIRALADTVISSLEDDKAEDITVINLEGKSSLADIT